MRASSGPPPTLRAYRGDIVGSMSKGLDRPNNIGLNIKSPEPQAPRSTTGLGHNSRHSTADWDEAPTVKKGRSRLDHLHAGGRRRGPHGTVCGESPKELVDAILAMRVDPGRPPVAGKLAGASTSTPATKDHAAELHCQRGPAGASAGPASRHPPQSDTQQGDYIPLSDLQCGDKVDVWSQTAQRWLHAVVRRVRDDDTLEVAYHLDLAGERWKDLPRFDPELRPFWPTRGVG